MAYQDPFYGFASLSLINTRKHYNRIHSRQRPIKMFICEFMKWSVSRLAASWVIIGPIRCIRLAKTSGSSVSQVFVYSHVLMVDVRLDFIAALWVCVCCTLQRMSSHFFIAFTSSVSSLASWVEPLTICWWSMWLVNSIMGRVSMDYLPYVISCFCMWLVLDAIKAFGFSQVGAGGSVT